MNNHRNIYNLSVVSCMVINLVQITWSAQDDKPTPITRQNVANLRAAFENNPSQLPTAIAQAIPKQTTSKPVPKYTLPPVPPKPKDLFASGDSYGVQKELSHEWLMKIFEAPMVKSNTTTISNRLSCDVAAKIKGPNQTYISHKTPDTGALQHIKDLLQSHPKAIAVLYRDEPAGSSTFGPEYYSTLATYHLYENNILNEKKILIENSKFVIMVAKLKDPNTKQPSIS